MMLKKIKFENRITLYFSMLVLFTVLISNIFIIINIRNKYEKDEKNKIKAISREIQERFFMEELERIVILGSFSERFATLIDRIRLEKIFIRISIDGISIFDNTIEVKEKVKESDDIDLKKYNNFKFYEKYISFSVQDKIYGHVVETYIIKDIRVERNLINQFVLNNILISIIGIMLAILMGKLTATRIVNPINKIINTANMIDLKKTGIRIPNEKEDYEISVLINVLNNMIDRIEDSYISQTRFVENASHELRTPLQIMRGYIDILSSWGKDNKEMVEEAILNIKEEIENTIHLVERLLFIAKGDKGNISLKIENLDISEFISKIKDEVELITKHNRIVIEKNEKCILKFDKDLLKQAIRAIIENSIKYSYENTDIIINSYKKGNDWHIKIKDFGIGISKEDLNKVFERFYRSDNSRTKDTGGTGLGLSIVKTIITLHNGSVFIDSELGKWTEVTIKIPVRK